MKNLSDIEQQRQDAAAIAALEQAKKAYEAQSQKVARMEIELAQRERRLRQQLEREMLAPLLQEIAELRAQRQEAARVLVDAKLAAGIE